MKLHLQLPLLPLWRAFTSAMPGIRLLRRVVPFKEGEVYYRSDGK